MSRPNAIVPPHAQVWESSGKFIRRIKILYIWRVDNPWDALITLKEFLKERKMDLKIPKYKKTK